MSRTVRLRAVLTFALLVVVLPSPREAGAGKAPNRSIYVPVKLDICEHIEEAALYRGETRIRSLPGQQTFQFTFYADLKRLLPESEVFDVRGTEKSGRDFEVELMVTPADVYIADSHIDLHPEEQLRDLGHKVDIRYHPVGLKLNCRDFCPRKTKDPSNRRERSLRSR